MGEKILVVPASVVRDSKLPEGYTPDMGIPSYKILDDENLSFQDRDGIEENWPDGVKRWMDAVPLGRMGQDEDVADAVLFFASDHAGWITGQVLSVDGGK